ncbi:hypothetical protein [Pseudogracilibacillus sp. SO30301A]|uniref:hypothetical protein n=1 Tax=Pseudogracilibacillus sp. SO30301A TaxID=3098291 RepID=UPI00300E5F4A
MNLVDAKRIIEEENLEGYCLFCNDTSSEEEVVITKEGDGWKVFTNNERATKIGEKLYMDENEALNDFIERLRGDKSMKKYFK